MGRGSAVVLDDQPGQLHSRVDVQLGAGMPHTVGTHLWHAFTKLGISSRVELTRLVLEHEAACHN
jgi:hypothetical protein